MSGRGTSDIVNDDESIAWQSQNQRILMLHLARIEASVRAYHSCCTGIDFAGDASIPDVHDANTPGDSSVRAATDSSPAAIDVLCRLFRLSPWERDVLLMAAGCVLSGSFAALCSAVGGVTFGIALSALPEAHWSGTIPNGPLRRWQLIDVLGLDSAGSAAPSSQLTLTTAPLRIDERILHYLAGVPNVVDPELTGFFEAGAACPSAGSLPGHEAASKRLRDLWSSKGIDANVVQITGGASMADRRALITRAGESFADASSMRATPASLNFGRNSAAVAPIGTLRSIAAMPRLEAERMRRRMVREAALSGARVLILEASDRIEGGVKRLRTPENGGEHDVQRNGRSTGPGAEALLSLWPGMTEGNELPSGMRLVLSLSERFANGGSEVSIPVISTDPLDSEGQRAVWQAQVTFGDRDRGLDRLVSHFDMDATMIRNAVAMAATAGVGAGGNTVGEADLLWEYCRGQARGGLEGLAERLDVSASWNDLVLPEAQRQILVSMATQVRQRATVYERWGFARRTPGGGSGGAARRGLGITALFAGPSGTGKTLAAEVVAHELDLDLYRIDLSRVISKYIGETEKNLAELFDAAEPSGAVLLFDEADALFGKRSDVKDSHDRYANIEVSYLLQRMETYRGLAILTTNLKASLDTAFLRRLRFVVQFTFPGEKERERLWRRAFPPETPTLGLLPERLAQLHIAGGSIRSIALGAAFLAADEDEPVQMRHLLTAVRAEYAKLEKSLTEMETAGWLKPGEKIRIKEMP